MLETGVWTASNLISFESYGLAPATLVQKGPAFGRERVGYPKQSPKSSNSVPTGGLAIFRIFLIPLSGETKTALLQVNCALGDVPRERSVEGIRITLERANSEYLLETSGRVMFLAERRQLTIPSKLEEQDVKPETSEQTQQ